MTDLEALYRAVLARPEEDTPRLAYADEVEERGDPERAELIRVQCEYASLDCVDRECPHMNDYSHSPDRWQEGKCQCRGCQLVRIEQTLLAENRERWEPACVACNGHGREWVSAEAGPDFQVNCPACKGTGRQPCRWERGFPVVEVAEMRQVWRVGKCPKCWGAGEIKYAVPEPPRFRWTHPKEEVPAPALRAEYRKCEACNSGAVWEPTPWLRDLLRTHHVAGVALPGETRVVRDTNVPPCVWDRIDFRDHFAPQFSRAVVLAALEWLDAREAA